MFYKIKSCFRMGINLLSSFMQKISALFTSPSLQRISAAVLGASVFLHSFVSSSFAQDTPTFTVDTSQALTDFKAGAVALIAFILVVFGVKKLISLYDGGK